MSILLVGLGGALGAISRFKLYRIITALTPNPTFLGTLLVNGIGCFLIGLLLANPTIKASMPLKWFFIIGYLGSFTTFSTYSYEIYHLFVSGDYKTALVYLGLSHLIGLSAIFFGIKVAGFVINGH